MSPSLIWTAGWSAIFAGFLAGAVLGMFFAAPDWLGGYASWPRRMVRLAHISLVALGMLDVLCALSMRAGFLSPSAGAVRAAAGLLPAGTVAMPLVCYLAAWRRGFRHAFAAPVLALAGGVGLLIWSGGRP